MTQISGNLATMREEIEDDKLTASGGHAVSSVYVGPESRLRIVPDQSEASEAQVAPTYEQQEMEFPPDYQQIAVDGLARARGELRSSSR